jgi:IS605 OrfB family transposase
VTVQAFKFALDPTPSQARDLLRHAGAARVAFNWGLAQVKANLSQREAERSYGIDSDDLTPSLSWSMYSMRRAWNQAKDDVAPWWAECSKEAYSTGLNHLAAALKNWSDSKKGKRAGRPVGFPKFKSRRRATPSVKFTTGTIRVEPDRKHVTLPVLGTIKTHESTRKLSRKIEAGAARILSATVRFERGRWYCSFTVEAVREEVAPRRPDAVVGVDLGIKTLAVLSEGEPVPNPRHFDAARRKLARTSRTVSRRLGPDRRTGRQPSNRWKRANAARNKVHHQVAAQRRDGLHKLTTRLAKQYGTIVIEDLNVAGMKRNKKLARLISDAGFGEFRRQLTYKTEWYGGRLVIADRWFPSSKTCSGCKTVKPKLSLAERVFTCEACGLVIDRDLNAALNLRDLVAHVAGSGPETLNGRRADRETRPRLAGGENPLRRTETSTPHRAPARARRGPAPGNERILEIH